MNVRRVVTGHDAHGKAVIVDDGVVEPTTVTLSPTVYHELWRADSAAHPSRRRRQRPEDDVLPARRRLPLLPAHLPARRRRRRPRGP